MSKQIQTRSLIVLILFLILPSSIFAIPWVNGQSATYVVGQSDFISNPNGCNSQSFNLSTSVAIDYANNCMYVTDYVNCRVLRFSYPLSGNYPAADCVFGQTNFTNNSTNGGVSVDANTFHSPWFVLVHDGDLWVSDAANHRILKWTNAYSITTNFSSADLVIGQANFTSTATGCSSTLLSTPRGLVIDASDNLWVADYENNRVLRFSDCNTLVNGEAADLVLGQSNFTSNGTGTTINTFNFNGGFGGGFLAFYGNSLWVSDFSNHRVLRFDGPFSTNQPNAVAVIGQADFNSGSVNRGGSTAANSLNNPDGVYIDRDGNLYICDASNYRILVYNNPNSLTGDAGNASYVLGQSSFTTSVSATTDHNFVRPYGVTGDGINSRIFVADFNNNRVLQFDSLVSDIPSLSFWAAIALIGFILIFGTIKIMKLR